MRIHAGRLYNQSSCCILLIFPGSLLWPFFGLVYDLSTHPTTLVCLPRPVQFPHCHKKKYWSGAPSCGLLSQAARDLGACEDRATESFLPFGKSLCRLACKESSGVTGQTKRATKEGGELKPITRLLLQNVTRIEYHRWIFRLWLGFPCYLSKFICPQHDWWTNLNRNKSAPHVAPSQPRNIKHPCFRLMCQFLVVQLIFCVLLCQVILWNYSFEGDILKVRLHCHGIIQGADLRPQKNQQHCTVLVLLYYYILLCPSCLINLC